MPDGPRAMIEQLISPARLRESGLWSENDKPSVRTLQNWILHRRLPCAHHGRRRFLPIAELQKCLERNHHWPNGIPRMPLRPLFQLELIRFSTVLISPLWHPSSRPCARTLRNWVRLAEIPHYRIGRSVFFNADEVAHCLITAKLVAAA